MNLPFNIKFIIFDENKAVSYTQEKLSHNIYILFLFRKNKV